MPNHVRSKADKATLSQLPLLLHAEVMAALDPQQRQIVVTVLARLLLEAAGLVASEDEADDAE